MVNRKTKSKVLRKREALRGYKQYLRSLRRSSKQHVPFIPMDKSRDDKQYVSRKNKQKVRSKTIKCPSIFSIEHNLQRVLDTLSNVRNLNVKKYGKIMIDLSEVVEFDITALVMLLSNLNHLSQKEVSVSGNYPMNFAAREFFERSGFLKHMKTINRRLLGSYSDHGLIVNIGKDNYNSNDIALINKKAIEHLGVSRQHYQRLNSIVGEMGGNTIKYAYHINKHYLYGFYKYEAYTAFVFADSGYGILKTLRKTFGRTILDMIQNVGDIKVLEGAFNKKYGSRTGEANRNRGLPFIKLNSDEGIVSDLQCISNNVMLDFINVSASQKLSSNYSGTVYSWKIYNNTK